MRYVVNAFSLNMCKMPHRTEVDHLTPDEFRAELRHPDVVQAIGFENTAAIVSGLLGCPIRHNRIDVALQPGDIALVAQYDGPRLEPGVTQLPEGAKIVWQRVTILPR